MEEGVLIIGLIIQFLSGAINLYHTFKNYLVIKQYIPATTNSSATITVIVAAHNEENNLKKLVPKLLNQAYLNFKVIVVLDRCMDNSLAYLKSILDPRLMFEEVNHLPANWNGKKYALKRGIDKAKSDWILLTDADCTPSSKNWIENMSKHISTDIDVVLGVGIFKKSQGLLNELIQYETLITASRYISNALKGKPFMGVGRNLAYRKSTFLKKDGFHGFEHIVGGDDDLIVQRISTKTNTAVAFGEYSSTYSEAKRTWSAYLKQKTRHLGVSKYYLMPIKWLHSIWFAAHITFWSSFLFLVTFNLAESISFSIFVIYITIKGLILKLTANRLGIKWLPMWIIIVDFIYTLFFPLWTLKSVLTKKIGWN